VGDTSYSTTWEERLAILFQRNIRFPALPTRQVGRLEHEIGVPPGCRCDEVRGGTKGKGSEGEGGAPASP